MREDIEEVNSVVVGAASVKMSSSKLLYVQGSERFEMSNQLNGDQNRIEILICERFRMTHRDVGKSRKQTE